MICEENLKQLIKGNKITGRVCIWGISNRTRGVLDILKENHIGIVGIIDSFKYTFLREFLETPVFSAEQIYSMNFQDMTLLIMGNYADAIIRQSRFLECENVFNLEDLSWKKDASKNISYSFVDRSKGKEALCYILAGYQEEYWESTIARIEKYQNESFDYCLCSSGCYRKVLQEIAERNQWSYLYTEENQVSFIQNQVIRLHPEARYVLKMDEDILISSKFFEDMLNGYKAIEDTGAYRIGFVVPVIPLNCAGYVSFLHHVNKEEEYTERYGRIYRSRFSAFMENTTAEFLWDCIERFDATAADFSNQISNPTVIHCYYNISCIMYARERWHLMGMWPEDGSSGMGMDEAYICNDNNEKDLAIYELNNVLAGHIGFGNQKETMERYYLAHREKFLP